MILTRTKLLLTSVLVLGSLAGCQTTPTTSFDYVEGTEFSNYRSFSWVEGKSLRFHTMQAHVSPLLEQHLKDAATISFAKAGLRYVDDASQADLLMAFTVGSRERILTDGYFGSFGPAISGDELDLSYWANNSRNLGPFIEGQVCVDLFDRKSGQPVWHGTADEDLDRDDLGFWREHLPGIMAAIAMGYPTGNTR